MAITYFCNDKHGNLYTRVSAGDLTPKYKTAAISRHKLDDSTTPVRKCRVSYSAKQATGIHPAYGTYEVVPVRAYVGRHKVEPAA